MDVSAIKKPCLAGGVCTCEGLYCTVKRNTKIFGSAVAALALGIANGRSATGAQDPRLYQTIPTKNVFKLKDPPPLTAPVKAAENPTVPKIFLNGITTIFGRKLALMKLMLPTKSPGDTGERSLMLHEGERENDVEVLQINEKNGSVRVNNFGTVLTLTFDRDGAKNVATTPAPGPATGGSIPAPTAPPVAPTTPSLTPTGDRWGRPKTATTAVPGVPIAPMQANGAAMTPAAGFVRPASNSVVTAPPNSPPAPTPAPQIPLTAEEQKVLNELEKNLNQSKAPATRAIVAPPAPQ